MTYKITEECTKCGACENECPVNAISFDGKKYVVNPDECIGCGTCSAICPAGAPKEIEE